MPDVGIRALKQNASAVVAQARSGEPVTVTDRGRPVAVLVPVTTSGVEALVSSDRARPALRRLRDLPAPARRRRARAALSEEVEEMRQTERY
jgi:prevent-host-death family protein